MIFDALHTIACFVLVTCGVLRMNHMTRATPLLDIIGWWCITVGAFAHGVAVPKVGVDWADALLISGAALVVCLYMWPFVRTRLGIADRRRADRGVRQ